MKFPSRLWLMLVLWPAFAVVSEKLTIVSSTAYVSGKVSPATSAEDLFNLADFGAIGDGVTDDGPALQHALDAIAESGGGTLVVPAGRYALVTSVQKDFHGLASKVTMLGVESETTVPPPTSNGDTLAHGLDLTTEFLPRTTEQYSALSIKGLDTLLIKDIAFVGTPNVNTDALVVLNLDTIENAVLKHCEFYGLSTLYGSGIVQSVRCRLTIEQGAFLGTTANSGYYGSVVQNLEWKGLTVTDSVFVDYGNRPEFYGKLGTSTPFSWINLGNVAAPTNISPQREAVIRSVFLDEGGFIGISSNPYRYAPPTEPIGLLNISGLFMNVSNLGTSGHYLDGLQHVLIEASHYGWSSNTGSAIHLKKGGDAILDRLECVDGANRIYAGSGTSRLTVIDSIYSYLDSQSPITRVITTESADDDPVQFVRQQFVVKRGRDPDAAAHYYWTNAILQCDEDQQCIATQQAALAAYLDTAPQPNFTISGRIAAGNGMPLSGVLLTLSGSQSATTQTGVDGKYEFIGLPTSGSYTIRPSRVNYSFASPQKILTTPAGDTPVDFTALPDLYTLSGRVINAAGDGIPGALVTVAGSQNEEWTTDSLGAYSFSVPAEGSYTINVSRANYIFGVSEKSYETVSQDQSFNFTGTLVNYVLSGHVLDGSVGLSGVTISLSGSQNQTTITNASGDYSFTVPAEVDYTLTPSLKHYTFTAASQSFTHLSAGQTANFNANLNHHKIAGMATIDEGQAIAGVVVELTGAQQASTTTDESGNYSFSNLAAGGHYTVTVSKPNYSFAGAVVDYPELSSDQIANFTGTLNSYVLSGQIMSDGKGLAGATVTLSGALSAKTVTDANGNYSFIVPAEGDYFLTPAKTSYLFAPESSAFDNLDRNQAANFSATMQRKIEFNSDSYSVSETARAITVTVNRTGDTSTAAEVIYSATDGTAQQRSDVTPVMGRLKFEPGQTSRDFTVLVTDDSYFEGDESLTLELRDAVGGELGNNNSATLTIADNDSGEANANPVDAAEFFVRQHYRDFLSRSADDEGLAFWSNQITSCGADAACIADRRMNVSAAFFLSIEFQQTGFLVYRLYKAAFAETPQHREEFLLDTRTIGQGVVVNTPGWETLLEANKTKFIDSFVRRARFSEAYPVTLTPAAFVDRLNLNAGHPLTGEEVAHAVQEFGGAATSEDLTARARVLRSIAENRVFTERQTNPAFVLMQYFGYLQRNPDETPDTNLDGYNFWLQKLNGYDGDFRRAEMVKAFLLSLEYRARFGAP